MRAILFRGFSKQKQQWIYGSLVIAEDAFPNTYTYFIYDEIHDMDEVVSSSIGQWTNKYDKDNNKIFEGDFVDAYKPNSYLRGIHEVYYDEKYSKYCYKGYENKYDIGNNKSGAWCKVVGNKYDSNKLKNT